MIVRPFVVTLLALVAGCTFVRGKGTQFQPHNGKADSGFQDTYYGIREVTPGHRICTPKDLLKTLLEDPTNCMKGLEGCSRGVEAVAGRLDGTYEALFAGTLARTDGEFDYVCRGGESPPDLHLLGLSGIGYMGSAAHVSELLAVDDPAQRDADWHVAMRPLLAYALFHSGDREHALPEIAELVQLPGLSDADRASMILYIGRWDGQSIVETCTKALSEPTQVQTAQACAWYLSRSKIAEALPLFGNTDPRLGLAGIRALGLSGDPRATETVTRAMNPATASDGQRIAARVALLNLGKKEALRDFLAMLAGNIGSRRSGNETPKLAPDDVAREAALETLSLTNRSFDRDVMKTLRKTSGSKNGKTAAAAFVALAYLNDETAIDSLVSIITGKDLGARTLVIEHIGGHAEAPGRHAATGGDGILSDPRLRDALLTTFTEAPLDAPGRTAAVLALANMKPQRKE